MLCVNEYFKKSYFKNVQNIFLKDDLDAWIFFSDKPLKLETNMYIEPQFFFTKISYMEEKQFFMKNGLRNVFINDGSFMNIHDFNLIYVCSVKFLEQ